MTLAERAREIIKRHDRECLSLQGCCDIDQAARDLLVGYEDVVKLLNDVMTQFHRMQARAVDAEMIMQAEALAQLAELKLRDRKQG